MSEELEALVDGRRMGRLNYERDRLRFRYDEGWRKDPASFPLSLSMPLTAPDHSDVVVRPFIWGLLPDNNELLRRWGRRYQVSPGNPFRLLYHVGEECAGAVQFVLPERAPVWLAGEAPEGVTWLDEDELAERIADLVIDHAGARRLGDRGQFSLAGAQPKTGLYRDAKTKRWGVPEGATPTTHILKPNAGELEGYDQNEHFCLCLARRTGLRSAWSWIEVIGENPVIVIERFDRVPVDGKIIRVHQEDTCQALGRMPDIKYQNQGGPSAKEIFDLIRDHSAKPQEDVIRFLDALIYNWLIGGTDAHSKNYGFLIAGEAQVRLAPLYDVSSCLAYPRDIPMRKAKLAMKIGGQYLLLRVGVREWEKAATEWKLDRDLVFKHIITRAKALPDAAAAIAREMAGTLTSADGISNLLVAGISRRAQECLQLFTAS